MRNSVSKSQICFVLEEFVGRRKSERIANLIFAEMQSKRLYSKDGKEFEISPDATIFTGISNILTLEGIEEKEECLDELKKLIFSEEKVLLITPEDFKYDLYKVEGYTSDLYQMLLRHTPNYVFEEQFLMGVRKAIALKEKSFYVPVCDPSIDDEGNLQFVKDEMPATYFSYNELVELGRKSGIRLGDINQWHLFLASLAINLILKENWSMTAAINAICSNSHKLGNYWKPSYDKIELTGSRMIVQKCDIGNTLKIVANNQDDQRFWLVGGEYHCGEIHSPLYFHTVYRGYDIHFSTAVGWYVI